MPSSPLTPSRSRPPPSRRRLRLPTSPPLQPLPFPPPSSPHSSPSPPPPSRRRLRLLPAQSKLAAAQPPSRRTPFCDSVRRSISFHAGTALDEPASSSSAAAAGGGFRERISNHLRRSRGMGLREMASKSPFPTRRLLPPPSPPPVIQILKEIRMRPLKRKIVEAPRVPTLEDVHPYTIVEYVCPSVPQIPHGEVRCWPEEAQHGVTG